MFNAIKELVKNECFRIRQLCSILQNRKYVIFTAGKMAQQFFPMLKQQLGIDVEFFVDNNPINQQKTLFDKQIKSFDDAFTKETRDDYIVLIPTERLDFYKQITEQLEEINMPYFRANAFIAANLYENYDTVANVLNDEESKNAYWSAIYSLMTGNDGFIVQSQLSQYFGIREFTHCLSLFKKEIIVDAGAWVGDTIEEYVKRSLASAKIYAFEPFPKLTDKLNNRVTRLKNEYPLCDNAIEIIVAGVGAKTETLRFAEIGSDMLQPSETGDIDLSVYSLDDFFKDKEPPTIIKADIEGAELDMLKGAAELIKHNKPKLAICIYHSPQEFASIADYIHSIVPEYRMYVRSHYHSYQDTILYCVL
jgi:FkbM family methyltransferase